METYVTLSDANFLPQVLSLHESMQRHCRPFRLWVLCVDDEAHRVLTTLELDSVRLINLGDVETEELLAVKRERSRVEYCWTLSPFAPRFVLDADPDARRVTYIDADLWFLRNPNPIFAEFEESRKSVLITEHAYTTGHDFTEMSGRYCVQFMVFTRTAGEKVREWWERRCLEWCYARYEDGKFGDQKYLDDWPERFAGEVHVLAQKYLASAPWNIAAFETTHPVFFHFHGLRLMRKNRVLLGRAYEIPAIARSRLYLPYLDDFACAIEKLRRANWNATVQENRPYWLLATRILLSGALKGLKFPWSHGRIVALPTAAALERNSFLRP